MLLEVLSRADSTAHQKLRRTDGSVADKNFTAGCELGHEFLNLKH